jgi:hypothetical protein
LILRRGTDHASVRHARDERRHVIDHEIERVLTAPLRGMDGHLGRRQRKDQPSRSDIDMWKAEHLSKKCAIGFSVRAVDDHVRAGYLRHELLYSFAIE